MGHLENEVRHLVQNTTLLPSEVDYKERLFYLFEVGRKDLSLAKLAEAHWDALSILNEAGRPIKNNSLYAVWASEIPHKPLKINRETSNWTLNGTKMFCSGAGIVDRALCTAEGWLIDVDLTKASFPHYQINTESWITSAFRETNTATLTFIDFPLEKEDVIGKHHWYLEREGFWKGALGPAACWGGGAAALVDYGLSNSRHDAHTLAHLAAMESNIWAIRAALEHAGQQVMQSLPIIELHKIALRVRHITEQSSSNILQRFARAYGPFPLACEPFIHQHYQELDLFLRQNHGERDLEALGALIHPMGR